MKCQNVTHTGGRSLTAVIAWTTWLWLAATTITTFADQPVELQPALQAGGIRVIDLAADKDRQVVVDREKGQYLGHPTTCLLEDGKTMLCVYPKGHGRGAIVYKRSDDGGLTWSDRLPTPENWATSREVPTLHRVVDATGKKRIIMWSGLYPARLAVSEDDGASWTPLKPVGDWGGIVVMGCLIDLKTGPGHYMAMFHDDGRFFASKPNVVSPRLMTLYKTVSQDGGLTWSFPEAIYKSSEVHLCEPGIIRSPDGKQLAVLLRENARRKNSHIIFSNDEGKTWTQPREMPDSLNGDRHTGKYAPDGRLLISFRSRSPKGKTAPTEGEWAAWVGTYDDLAQGRPGEYHLRLADNHKGYDCAYPGVEVLPDGTFVTTTYGHWEKDEAPFILSVRLNLEELDAISEEEIAAKYSVTKIWDGAPHNAFTDLIQYNDQFHCAFREGTGHVPGASGEDGKIRVIASADGCTWQSVGLIIEEGIDLRDPKLSITPDGRLMVLMGGSDYDGVRLLRRCSRVAFYDVVNKHFGKSVPVQIDDRISGETDWLWRVTWHAGTGYGVVYKPGTDTWGLHLVKTSDGVRYDLVKTLDVEGRPNETTIRFLPDGEMVAVVRNEDHKSRGHLGRSRPPYTEWTWHDIKRRLGGPNFVRLPNGAWILGSRLYGRQCRTAIGPLAPGGNYDPTIVLPSGGDTSYPGLLVHEDKLWMTYYSGHQGRTSIYLAQIPLNEFKPASTTDGQRIPPGNDPAAP